MKTLIIKDLALTAELDRSAMAAVHGGYLPYGLFGYSPKISKVIDAEVAVQQLVDQKQNFSGILVGNVAFPKKSDVTFNLTATQDADNDSHVDIRNY